MKKLLSLFLIALLFHRSFLFSDQTNDRKLKKLVLIHSEEMLVSDPNTFSLMDDFELLGVLIPEKIDLLKNEIYSNFIGKELDSAKIKQLETLIYSHYEKNGYPFTTVSIPEQNISEGTLQVVVQESRVGKVDFVGNSWAPVKIVRKSLNIQPEDRISKKELLYELDYLNRNPFRSVNVIFSPGTEELTTDLTVEIQAARPYHFYAGTDNTGISTTGKGRIFAGVNWNQLFGLDQTLMYQYTTNYGDGLLQAHTVQYTAYLPKHTVLNIYGGYANLRADIDFPNRINKGRNIQASLRLNHPLVVTQNFIQDIRAGFDWKNTNNNIEYTEFLFPVFSQIVNLTQWTLGYLWSYYGESMNANGALNVFSSPGQWLSNQKNSDYSHLRPGAKNHWIYLLADANYTQKIKTFTYSLFFRGQLSSTLLIPSEQLGIGGYNTVRGYEERQFNADSGFIVSNEILSPPISVFRSKKNSDRLQFLIFLDGGWGVDYQKIGTLNASEYLIGTGPGLRYSLGSYINARLDWGFKLHQQAVFNGGNSQLYFSFVAGY